MPITYDVFTRIVTLGVILIPVLRGELIRPGVIFPVLLLIRQFIEACILRTIMMPVLRLSEVCVTATRLEVFLFNYICFVYSDGQC